ncbi:hypothetical protein BJ742DRAFT_282254 [Cladochytrium replicatum]|nr:hypothetical protein BJ742DRAFT_282254 [Cladochytrium replicatum]
MHVEFRPFGSGPPPVPRPLGLRVLLIKDNQFHSLMIALDPCDMMCSATADDMHKKSHHHVLPLDFWFMVASGMWDNYENMTFRQRIDPWGNGWQLLPPTDNAWLVSLLTLASTSRRIRALLLPMMFRTHFIWDAPKLVMETKSRMPQSLMHNPQLLLAARSLTLLCFSPPEIYRRNNLTMLQFIPMSNIVTINFSLTLSTAGISDLGKLLSSLRLTTLRLDIRLMHVLQGAEDIENWKHFEAGMLSLIPTLEVLRIGMLTSTRTHEIAPFGIFLTHIIRNSEKLRSLHVKVEEYQLYADLLESLWHSRATLKSLQITTDDGSFGRAFRREVVEGISTLLHRSSALSQLEQLHVAFPQPQFVRQDWTAPSSPTMLSYWNAVGTMPRLKLLDLSGMCLEYCVVCVLCEILQSTSTIKRLILSKNGLTNEHLTQLVRDGLDRNTTLTALNIESQYGVSGSGWAEFLRCLGRTTFGIHGLKILVLDGNRNNFSDTSVDALTDFVRVSERLQLLSLESGVFDWGESRRALEEVARTKPRLRVRIKDQATFLT